VDLINNRQGGRRRGRGGQGGGRNLGGGGQPGNRQDNRQRGNAAQLLEKYKSMARDAQLAGDRVQTEYYLQYADHYFRVLGENRSRFEEQSPRRSRDEEMDDEDDNNSSDNERSFHRGEEDLAEGGDEGSGEDRSERPERAERQDRGERPYRNERNERFSRPNRPRPEQRSADDEDGREDRRPSMNGGDDSLPLDVLPPAIGREPQAEEAEAADDQPRRPRRRTRAVRPAEGDDKIAPAA
jgi:hypothetical protein